MAFSMFSVSKLRHQTLMKLVLLTNPYDVKFETDIINRLFREGLDELHIRKPRYSKEQVKAYISKIDAEYHPKLVLHGYYSLANTFEIHRIHIGEEWRKNTLLRFILSRFILRGKMVSKSTTVNSYKSLYNSKEDIQEVMLGPIFSQNSADSFVQLVKLASLAKAIDQSGINIIGIGGVAVETIPFFKQSGFSGVALQSYIWKSMDPVKAFIDMVEANQTPVRHLKVMSE
jgi:thiamine-phosphate pyrophosphorylase